MWNRECAVGTPGIGKTTVTTVLIQMLLKKIIRLRLKKKHEIKQEDEEDIERTKRGRWNGGEETGGKWRKRTAGSKEEKEDWTWYRGLHYSVQRQESVVLRIQTHRRRQSFLRTGLPRTRWCRQWRKSSTYYIVDPGKTKDTCDPHEDFQAKVIIVSLPDHRHWGETEFLKEKDPVAGILLYYPVWTLDERNTAGSEIERGFTRQLIIERYRQFGGVPGRVFWSPFKSEICFANSKRGDQ